MAKRRDLLTIPMTVDWNGKSNRKYFLRYLLEKNNFTSMAEVGVRDGRTTFYLLDSIPNLKIYAIDLSITGFYNEKIKSKYGERLIPIQSNSHIAAASIPNVDLVFIDADHSYAGCSGDIKAYRNKINPGGILSGHDIDYPGVNKAVREQIQSYEVGPNNVWFTISSVS